MHAWTHNIFCLGILEGMKLVTILQPNHNELLKIKVELVVFHTHLHLFMYNDYYYPECVLIGSKWHSVWVYNV